MTPDELGLLSRFERIELVSPTLGAWDIAMVIAREMRIRDMKIHPSLSIKSEVLRYVVRMEYCQYLVELPFTPWQDGMFSHAHSPIMASQLLDTLLARAIPRPQKETPSE